MRWDLNRSRRHERRSGRELREVGLWEVVLWEERTNRVIQQYLNPPSGRELREVGLEQITEARDPEHEKTRITKKKNEKNT